MIMSYNILSNDISMYIEMLMKYISSFELTSPTDENIYFQRFKLLASISKGLVQFKQLDEQRYLLHTTHEVIPSNLTISDYPIDKLVPFRSCIINVENMTLEDYSIFRIRNISNSKFLDIMKSVDDEDLIMAQAVESYEGSVIVAKCENDKWNLRTTSCIDAKESFFNSEVSHYDTFSKLCDNNIDQKLNELKNLYNTDVYFVFVLVSTEHSYLCDYQSSKAILIAARDMNNCDLKLDTTETFLLSKVLGRPDVESALNDNSYFKDNKLPLQGFLFKHLNGTYSRTFTKAYNYGLNNIPNTGSIVMDSFNSYLKKHFDTYARFKKLSDEDYYKYKSECNIILETLKHLIGFLFKTFTKITIKNGKKTYEKLNGDLFKSLDENNTYMQHFKKIIAILQSYSLHPDAFNHSADMKYDIENFIRSLANKEDTFKLLFDILTNYTSFVELINSKVNNKFNNILHNEFNKISLK